ncbi:MAG: mechanosensitive ion channel [Alphaproteobacteria bacterium]|nr:MAG: mechanosensitive ion channel [Alphaproteobacteria bacterium]
MLFIYLLLFVVFLVMAYFRKEISRFVVNLVFRFLPEGLAALLTERLTRIFFALEILILSKAMYPLYEITKYFWLYNIIFTGVVLGSVVIGLEVMSAFFLYTRQKSDFLKEADSIDLTNFLTKISKFIIVLIAILTLLKQYSQDEFKLSSLISFLGFLTAAISFAAREYIANFFGSIGILFSNPFSKGDKIFIENTEGIVESFGFQQTAIRHKDQSIVYIPNAKLIVQNIYKNKSRMKTKPILVDFYISSHVKETDVDKSFAAIVTNLTAFDGMVKNNKPEAYISEIAHGLFKVHVRTTAKSSENTDILRQKVFMIIRDELMKNNIQFENEGESN